jgi:methionine-rich copper-binding protein CopC
MKPPIYAAMILALSLGFAGEGAQAHATKEATQPADGAVLDASPPAIAMQFDMPMRVTLLALTDQDGAAHSVTRTDNMQPVSTFTAAPTALPAGRYTVEWRGLAEDGHPMQGTFRFEITQ